MVVNHVDREAIALKMNRDHAANFGSFAPSSGDPASTSLRSIAASSWQTIDHNTDAGPDVY
jgi:hypothetical protein